MALNGSSRRQRCRFPGLRRRNRGRTNLGKWPRGRAVCWRRGRSLNGVHRLGSGANANVGPDRPRGLGSGPKQPRRANSQHGRQTTEHPHHPPTPGRFARRRNEHARRAPPDRSWRNCGLQRCAAAQSGDKIHDARETGKGLRAHASLDDVNDLRRNVRCLGGQVQRLGDQRREIPLVPGRATLARRRDPGQGLAHAEVGHQRPAAGVHQDIFRPEIAVAYSPAMRVIQGASDLFHHPTRHAQLHGSGLSQHVAQRAGVDIPRGIPEERSTRTRAVHRHDMGMVETSSQLHCAVEALDDGGVCVSRAGQHRHTDRSTSGVSGGVHPRRFGSPELSPHTKVRAQFSPNSLVQLVGGQHRDTAARPGEYPQSWHSLVSAETSATEQRGQITNRR